MSAGFTVRELDSGADYQAALDLQERTWGPGFSERVPVSILKLAQRMAGVAAGAFAADGTMLGLVFGISGLENGEPVHWSDMLAVAAQVRDRGIGDALKRYQRETLLARGVRRVYWSFDPLESRNAHVNFVRLGVSAREYVRNFYGESDSPLHAGIGTDRLIALWQIDSRRVEDRLARREVPDEAARQLTLVNEVRLRADIVHCEAPRLGLDEERIRMAVPSNIQHLKTHHSAIAVAWRVHTRAAFEHYLARGYVVQDFLRGERFGSYVLARRPLLA